jgi:hypothetical protein
MSRATIRVDDGSPKRTIPAGITIIPSNAGDGSNPPLYPPSVTVTKQYGNMSNNVLNNGVNTQTVSAFVDANSPIHHLDIEGMSSSATSCTDRIINSGAATWSSSAGSALAKGTYFGKDCINIDACNQISVSNSMGNLPQYYTMFAVWYPRVTDSGWRTWWRGSNDHLPMVNNGSKALGVYSNRSGNTFYSTGYNISIDWQTVIVTGAGASSTDANGTSTFYINGTSVGTVGRTKCGTTGDSFGWSGQAPGYFMEIGILGKLLNSTEIADLHSRLNSRMGGAAAGASWNDEVSQSSVGDGTDPQTIIQGFDKTVVPVTKNPRQQTILPNSVRARIDITGKVNTRLQDTAAVQLAASGGGGGGGGGGGSDSAVASAIKQIWY